MTVPSTMKTTTMTTAAVRQSKQEMNFAELLYKLEKILVVLMLVPLSRGFIHGQWLGLPLLPFQVIALGFAALVLWKYLPQILQTLVSDPPMTLFIIFSLASIFWTIDLSITMDGLQWFLLSSVYGLYIAIRFPLEEQLQLYMWFTIVTAALSLMAVLVFPSNGIHQAGPHTGLWQGIFTQKNQLAMFMASGAVVVIMLGHKMGRWRFVFGALLVLMTFGARSGTGILAMVAMFFVVPQLQVLRLRHQWMTGLVMMLIPIALATAIILAGNFDALLGSVGKDATLTGRTELWNASFVLIEERTALGWGWSASFAPSSPVHNMITWSAPFAHNHWIDMTLDVGMIGSLIFMVGLILMLLRAIVYAQQAGTRESLFPLVYIMIVHIMILSTQALMTKNDALSIFYVSLAYGLAIHGTKLSRQPYRMNYRREKFQEELNDPIKFMQRRRLR